MSNVKKTYPDWKAIEGICQDLSDRLTSFGPDLIVAITRGGLPAATLLSHMLNCRSLVAVTATKSTGEGPGSLEIDDQAKVQDLGWIPDGVRKVLIVDDVVAKGDVFSAVADAIRKRTGNAASIAYACLYGDRPRITAGPYATIVGDLQIGVEVDNVNEWIVFPWERE